MCVCLSVLVCVCVCLLWLTGWLLLLFPEQDMRSVLLSVNWAQTHTSNEDLSLSLSLSYSLPPHSQILLSIFYYPSILHLPPAVSFSPLIQPLSNPFQLPLSDLYFDSLIRSLVPLQSASINISYSSLFCLPLSLYIWRVKGGLVGAGGGYVGCVCLSYMLSSMFDKNPVSAHFICC